MRKRNHHPFVIAIDIDETILRSFDVLLSYLNTSHDTSHERADLTEHDWERASHLVWTRAQVDNGWDELFRSNGQLNQFQHLVDGAQEGIKKLSDAGARIIAITGRGKRAHKSTQHLLNTFFPGLFSSVYYVDYRHNSLVNKGQLARQHHVKVAIDDNPDFLRELNNEGIDTYGLNTPWNQNIKRDGLNTKFFDHWDELVTDLCKSHTLELSRAHRINTPLSHKNGPLIASDSVERHMVDISHDEQHLMVVEPHSHEIISVAPHSHDLTVIQSSHPLVQQEDLAHELMVVSPHVLAKIPNQPRGIINIDTKEDVKSKTKKTQTRKKKTEVATQ